MWPEPHRNSRGDALALLGLALLHLALFGGVLRGDETLYWGDFLRYQLPLRSLVAEAWGEGRLPLWNPYLWLGTPLAANPAAGAFYPATFLLLPLDDLRGLNAAVVLHLYLGGAFTYGLARERAGSGAPAFAAGVAFSLGGIALSYAVNPFYLFALTWLPATLLCFERALARRPVANGVLAGVTVGLMILAGDVQLPLVAALVVAAVAAGRVALARAGDRLAVARRALVAGAICAAVGLGLAAIQLLPAVELGSISERALPLSPAERQRFSLHPARVGSLLVPYLFGVQLPENSYWGFALGEGPRFWFLSLYSGALLLAFVPAALRRGDGSSLALLVAAVALLLLAFGRHAPLYEPVAAAIPGLDRLRYPEKFVAPLAVLLPVLGAEGMARALSEERWRRPLVGLVGLAVAGVALWALERTLRSSFEGSFPVPFLAETAARRIARDGRNLFAFAAAAAAVLAVLRLGGARPAAVSWALGALAAADVAVAGARLVWTEPAAVARRSEGVARRIRGDGAAPPRLFRRTSLDPIPLHRTAAEWRTIESHSLATILPNTGVLSRVGTLTAYGAGAPADVYGVFTRVPDEEAVRVARVLAAPWVLAADGAEAGLPRIALYRVPDALPRARLAGASVRENTIPEVRALLRSGHDFARQAVVEAAEGLRNGEPLPAAEARALTARLPAEGAGEARVVAYRAEEVAVEVVARRRSLLVLAEAFFPGWRAEIDGREVPLFRADFLARAVEVPAGTHRVRFWFEAPAVALGARVSAATLGALLLLALLEVWRRRARGGEPRARPQGPVPLAHPGGGATDRDSPGGAPPVGPSPGRPRSGASAPGRWAGWIGS